MTTARARRFIERMKTRKQPVRKGVSEIDVQLILKAIEYASLTIKQNTDNEKAIIQN